MMGPWELAWRFLVALGAVVVISQWVKERWSSARGKRPVRCVYCGRPITPLCLDTASGPMHKHCFLSHNRRSS